MEKNKKVLRVLSTAAMTSAMTVLVSSTAFAKTTDILAKDTTGKYYQYNYQDIVDSIMGDQVLFNEFKKIGGTVAYKDDIKGYVDFNYISTQFMYTDKKSFKLDYVTENAPASSINTYSDPIFTRVENSSGVVVNGTIINNVQNVASVSVSDMSIEESNTKNLVVAVRDQYGDIMTSGYTISYAITSGISTVDASTGVFTAAKYSAITSNNINRLAVTVTPKTGAAITAYANITVTADVNPPTISSVQAINSKQIKVVYSENVDQYTAEDINNYRLYAITAGKIYNLVPSGFGGPDKVEANAKLQSDGKTVLINILNTSSYASTYQSTSEQAGFEVNGMSNTDYLLYVNSVKDKAGIPNIIATDSNKQFTGTLAGDTTAPTVSSATYDTGLNQLILSFDEAANVNLSSISIVSGSNQVALTGASSSITGTTDIITLTSNQIYALGGTIQSDAKVILGAGAVTDLSGNTNISAITASITKSTRPQINYSYYYENSSGSGASKLCISFNQAIKLSSVDLSKIKVQWSSDGTNYSDLTTLNSSNYSLNTTGDTSSTLEYTLNQTAIDAISAKRDVSGSYRIAIQDGAVANSDGVYNDVSAVGGSDYQYNYLNYYKDSTSPTITSANFYTSDKSTVQRYPNDTAGVNGNHLYIRFSEKINPSSITNDGKLVLEYGTGTSKTSVSLTSTSGKVAKTTLLADGQTLDVAFQSGDETAALAANTGAGEVDVKVLSGTSIVDMNKNAVSPESVTVNSFNTTSPASVSASLYSKNLIKLTQSATNFGGAAGSIGTNNFTVKVGNNVQTIKSVSMIDSNGDGKKDAIFIELNTSLDSVQFSSINVSYNGLKDSIGQDIPNGTASTGTIWSIPSPTPKLIKKVYTDNGDGTISSGDTITLTFDEPVIKTDNCKLYEVYGSGATINATNANEMVITLGNYDSTKSPIVFGTTKLQIQGNDIIKDLSGDDYDGSNENIPTPSGADAPALSSDSKITIHDQDNSGAISKGDIIQIPFDKTININNTASISLSHNSKIIDPKKYVVAASGKNVTITFTDSLDAIDKTDATNWSISIDKGSGIKNSWGVEATPFSSQSVTVSTDNKPYITAATFYKNDSKLVVTFFEPINLTDIGSVGQMSELFWISGENSLGDLTSTTAGAGGGFYLDSSDKTNKTVIFCLKNARINKDSSGVSPTLNAKDGGATNGAIKDFDGNKLVRQNNVSINIQ